MPMMCALKKYGWRDGTVQKGDRHEATEDEAKLLVALEWAEVVGLDESKPERTYLRRDMTASDREPE